MAQLTIGQAGYDVELVDPARISYTSRSNTSRQVGLSGLIHTSGSLTVSDAKNLRQQLVGLVGKHVAVTYVNDPDIDGFYTVQSANVEVDAKQASLINGTFPFSVSLTELVNPVFQSTLVGATIVNTNGITTTASPYVAPPAGFETYTPSRSYVDRASDAGTVQTFYDVSPDDHPVWTCTPANFYKAAAKLTVNGYPITGLVVPETVTSWSLDNGIVRLQPSSGSDFEIAIWSGSAFGTATTFTPKYNSSTLAGGTWVGPYVLRNDPETVTIRLLQARTANSQGRHTVDFTLRRGALIVSAVWEVDYSSEQRITRTTVDAATSVTGGIYDTAGPADKWVLTSPDFTADTTNGGIYKTGTQFKFAIGMQPSGAGTYNQAQQLVYQYHGGLTEKVAVRSAEGT